MKNQKQPVDTRRQLLTDWIRSHGFDADSLRPASADASFRRYFRAEKKARSFIIMDAPPAQNDNQAFIDIGNRLLSAGLNVPEIVESDLARGFVLTSDLGTTHYLDKLNTDNADSLYADAIDALIIMQDDVDTAGLPVCDETFLRTEMNLMPVWFLKRHLGVTLSTGQQKVLEDTFSLCLDTALVQPRLFMHRDYHSRNLMITGQHNPGIIDFQGALLGPVTYDLASLLKDCYIRWPQDRVENLLALYHTGLRKKNLVTIGLAEFTRWFDLMGLQRHIKVLGIFCRLHYRDGKNGYMNDMPMVYSYIRSVCGKYPELEDFAQLLTDTGAEAELG